MQDREDYRPGQEARKVSETRFGPRPPITPDSVHLVEESRRIPPSGRVSPRGDREWTEPATTTKVLVAGGAAIAAAAAVAGLVIVSRKVADAISGGSSDDHGPRHHDSHRDRHPRAPRFAAMDDDEHEEMRRRVRRQAREDDDRSERLRQRARQDRSEHRGPNGGPNTAHSLMQTAGDLSNSLNGLMGTIVGAVSGFRSVAGQAEGIVREFSDAAGVVRRVLGSRDQMGNQPEGRAAARTSAQDYGAAPTTPRDWTRERPRQDDRFADAVSDIRTADRDAGRL